MILYKQFIVENCDGNLPLIRFQVHAFVKHKVRLSIPSLLHIQVTTYIYISILKLFSDVDYVRGKMTSREDFEGCKILRPLNDATLDCQVRSEPRGFNQPTWGWNFSFLLCEWRREEMGVVEEGGKVHVFLACFWVGRAKTSESIDLNRLSVLVQSRAICFLVSRCHVGSLKPDSLGVSRTPRSNIYMLHGIVVMAPVYIILYQRNERECNSGF